MRTMKPGIKLAAFALLLAAVFGGGAAVGAAVGPIDVGGGADHGPAPVDGPSASTVPHPGHQDGSP